VKHANGRLRAVCSNAPAECDSLDLTPEDVECLALDRVRLGNELIKLLKCSPASEILGSTIGIRRVSAGVGIPVLLSIPGPFGQLDPGALPITPSMVLIPTLSSLSSDQHRAIATRHSAVLALSEVAVADGNGALSCSTAPDSLFSVVLGQVHASRRDGKTESIWTFPPGTQWEELTLEFMDIERVLVRFRGEQKIYEPDQFGMKSAKNGRATLAWKILLRMAIHGGKLRRPDDMKNRVEKQKELLSRRLGELFPISGDPMPFDRQEGAYVARLQLRHRLPTQVIRSLTR
jgi:hypothetical protein